MPTIRLIIATLVLLIANPAISATTYLFWGVITDSLDEYDSEVVSWNKIYEGIEVGSYFSGGLIYDPSIPYSSWAFFLAGELTHTIVSDPGDRFGPSPHSNPSNSTIGYSYTEYGHRYSVGNSLALQFDSDTIVDPLPQKLDLDSYISGYYSYGYSGYSGIDEGRSYLRGEIIELVEAPLPPSSWLLATALMGLISRKLRYR